MKDRLNALLAPLRPAGVCGLAILFACAVFYGTSLAPLERESALRQGSGAPPDRRGQQAEELRRFHALFPGPERIPDELERLHALARGAGLELSQGDYRLEKREEGLWAYRIALPVRGTYPQVRGFLAASLKEMTTTSLDSLRFERRRPVDSQLEAQLRFTLHLRPAGVLS